MLASRTGLTVLATASGVFLASAAVHGHTSVSLHEGGAGPHDAPRLARENDPPRARQAKLRLDPQRAPGPVLRDAFQLGDPPHFMNHGR